LEGLVCPPYTACLLRRISLNYVISCDGLILAKAVKKTRNFRVALEHVASKLEEWAQCGLLPKDQELIGEIYLGKLKS